ncbi:MAG: hypothetical protein J6K18_01030 [Bacilli bacterium]|nr:hypothetical protein [Bacilli bacterium]
MSKKINQSIKAITEGGIFTAGYALLAIISRYLITGTDSLIYYFTPLLMAIYIARNKISYSIAVLAASITLSFLFVNPLIALMVIMPNIIIGFVFGCLEKYNKVKIINYVLTFISCLCASLLSIYSFELINGIGYWADLEELALNFANTIGFQNTELISSIVNISVIIIIIVDSLIKSILLYLVFALIVIRLKLIKDYTLKIKLPLKFKTIYAIGYILLIILLLFLFNRYVYNNNELIQIVIIMLSTILFMYSFYLIYQFITFMRFKLKKIKNSSFILIILFSVLIFPIPIIFSIILNLINYNILLDLL